MKQQRITGVHFEVYSLLSIEMLNSIKSVINIIPFWKSVFLNAELWEPAMTDKQPLSLFAVPIDVHTPTISSAGLSLKYSNPGASDAVHQFQGLVKHITGQTVNSLPK